LDRVELGGNPGLEGSPLLLVKELPLSSPKSAKLEAGWDGELSRKPERFLAGKAGELSWKAGNAGELPWKAEEFPVEKSEKA